MSYHPDIKDHCAWYNRVYRNRLRASGLCTQCATPTWSYRCARCAALNAEVSRRWYKANRDKVLARKKIEAQMKKEFPGAP